MRIVSSTYTRVKIGDQFGRLKCIGIPFYTRETGLVGQPRIWVVLRCSCKKIVCSQIDSLIGGRTASCGCLQKERTSKATKGNKYRQTHGCSYKRLYHIWQRMRQRCYDKNLTGYKSYGGRGIKVCASWKQSFEVFKKWAESNGYKSHLQIDRIDNDGHYESKNCRWTDTKTQANNKRNSVYLTAFGKTRTVGQWVDEYKINRCTFVSRLERGWSVEDALTRPLLQ